ncbi:hypothetical protein LINPERHAP1_LOCUS40641 [Linum perenne]
MQLDSKAAIDAIEGAPNSTNRHSQILHRIDLSTIRWQPRKSFISPILFGKATACGTSSLVRAILWPLAIIFWLIVTLIPGSLFFPDCIGASLPIAITLNN